VRVLLYGQWPAAATAALLLLPPLLLMLLCIGNLIYKLN